MESSSQGATAVDSAVTAFRTSKQWADQAIAQLDDQQLHAPLDKRTNSVAVIMKHVAGNLRSRWTDFLSSDGEKPWRQRDDEFVDTFASRAEALACWEEGWECLFATLQNLSGDDLARTVTIRGQPHTVALAIARSLSHCSYHVGQIMLIARILVGDRWQIITIPQGESEKYNQQVWGQGHYGPSDEAEQ